MRKMMFNQSVRWCVRTPEASIIKGCSQAFIFCIAFPLACFVVVFKGARLLYRLLISLSFTCCMWIFLTALTLLFLLVFVIQFAVASVG
jgi:presenilin-like A22 family membrane protease